MAITKHNFVKGGTIFAEDFNELENQVDEALTQLSREKVDKDGVYTKIESDIALETKANIENVYNKEEIDTLLEAKADSETVDFQGTAIKDLQTENVKQNNDIALLNRKVSALEQLNEGVSYRFETDSTEAYSKVVPTGAKVFDLKAIGGKSVVANQLVGTPTIINNKYVTYDDVKNEYTISYNEGETISSNVLVIPLNMVANHKYYMYPYYVSVSQNAYIRLYVPYLTTGYVHFPSGDSNVVNRETKGYVFTYEENNQASVAVAKPSNFTEAQFVKIRLCIVDLTQMFGAGNEPTLEQCNEIFTEYIPYTEPTIISQSVENVKVQNKAGEITHNLTIPNECKDLKSAGEAHDTVEFYEQDGKHYAKKIQRLAILTLNVDDMNNVEPHPGWVNSGVRAILGAEINMYFNNALFEMGNTIAVNTTSTRDIVYLPTTYYNLTQSEWKQQYAGRTFHFIIRLETPIETIYEISNDFEAISCEANGSITFEANTDYKLPIPNEEEYMIKLSEV